MKFTYDWFSHNIPNWTKWLAEFNGKPCRALEIGCFEGKSTVWLLENILTDDKSHIVVVDSFAGSEEHREFKVGFDGVKETFIANVKQWAIKVSLFDGLSADVVRHFTGPFDIAHIDGSHLAPDVLTDACMVWPILNRNGIVIFDDYAWDHYPDVLHNPRAGVDAFLSIFAGQFKMIETGYQVCIQKI